MNNARIRNIINKKWDKRIGKNKVKNLRLKRAN